MPRRIESAPGGRIRQRLLPALRAAAALAAVAVVVVMAVRAARDVDFGQLRWWPLAPALVAAVTWWLLLARGWSLLSRGAPQRAAVLQWCRTQVLRYLPGGIWAPVSRVALLRGSALDRTTTVLAENAFAAGAALAVGGAALAADGRLPWALAVLALVAAPAAARLLGDRTRLAAAHAGRTTSNYVAAFGAYAAAAVAVQAAVSGFSQPLAVAGAAAVAWAAGLAVVVAPSGIGVREVAYVALLAPALPAAEATAGAVSMRLVMIAAELLVLVGLGRAGREAPAPAPTSPS